jgi:hypothetical protein
MRSRLASTLLAGLALAGSAAAANAVKKPHPGRSTELPRPLAPDVAVRSELEAARRAGTLAAYDLFIARHSNHQLAEVARHERAALASRQK